MEYAYWDVFQVENDLESADRVPTECRQSADRVPTECRQSANLVTRYYEHQNYIRLKSLLIE